MGAKKANEHESGLGVGQVRLVGQVGRVGLVRESKPSTPPHGGDGGGSSLSPPCEFQNFLCVYCKHGFISYQYLCTVENIKRTNNEN